ncbi:Uncharacterised protein [Mycoplasmopsis maculosa]|uniref:Uncharacterized protein n=1 Tax=Mycoplasmopsis maculosa TaxID=114885 RepID=A0A449B506_9BACT|nr:hypothetical protein [Mycoplasmopsis maculosa]VEU75655.1 Uncharacterised protein [Mycoplasmopsis maculosa]
MNITYENYFNSNINSKEKAKIIKSLCVLEKINSKIINDYKQHNKNILNLLKRKKPAFRIYNILAAMKPIYAKIIENDFIQEKENKWYNKEMKKSTYYRNKNLAMDEFLFLYINAGYNFN